MRSLVPHGEKQMSITNGPWEVDENGDVMKAWGDKRFRVARMEFPHWHEDRDKGWESVPARRQHAVSRRLRIVRDPLMRAH